MVDDFVGFQCSPSKTVDGLLQDLFSGQLVWEDYMQSYQLYPNNLFLSIVAFIDGFNFHRTKQGTHDSVHVTLGLNSIFTSELINN
jgi:hypothetical protein